MMSGSHRSLGRAGVGLRFFLIGAICFVLASCDPFGIDQVCTRELRSAIAVRMLDAGTGELPVADSGRITVSDGDFIETATVPPHVFESSILMGLASERPGTYSVEVEVPGYELWTTEDVRVDMTEDGCHVDTRIVTAMLQPANS